MGHVAGTQCSHCFISNDVRATSYQLAAAVRKGGGFCPGRHACPSDGLVLCFIAFCNSFAWQKHTDGFFLCVCVDVWVCHLGADATMPMDSDESVID